MFSDSLLRAQACPVNPLRDTLKQEPHQPNKGRYTPPQKALDLKQLLSARVSFQVYPKAGRTHDLSSWAQRPCY